LIWKYKILVDYGGDTGERVEYKYDTEGEGAEGEEEEFEEEQEDEQEGQEEEEEEKQPPWISTYQKRKQFWTSILTGLLQLDPSKRLTASQLLTLLSGCSDLRPRSQLGRQNSSRAIPLPLTSLFSL